MAPPTAYTTAELATFALAQLDALATALAWTTASASVTEAVNDAVLAYGVADVADATDIPKLRALARVSIWRAVARATVGYYRFGADQMSFERGQVHEHALAMIGEAEREATALGVGVGSSLIVATVVRDSDSDPYAAHPSQWGEVAV